MELLRKYINDSKKIVFFTGAGISVPSGLKDFRSSNGLYSTKYKDVLSIEVILSHDFFYKDPDTFYEFYFSALVNTNVLPNVAHNYIKSLEMTKEVYVVTQNIDGLHEMANSKNVYPVHGTIMNYECVCCKKKYSLNDIVMNGYKTPYCKLDNGLIKPIVTLYGEALDNDIVDKAIDAIKNADLLIVIGTSLSVSPANYFIKYFTGNKKVIINKDKTLYDKYFDLVIHDDIVNVINMIK